MEWPSLSTQTGSLAGGGIHGSHHFNLPPQCSLASWDGRVRQGGQLCLRTLGWALGVSAIVSGFCPFARSDLGRLFSISPPSCPPHCHQGSTPRPPALSRALQLGPVHVVPGCLGEPSVFGVHLFPVHVALHHGSLPFHIPCLFPSPPPGPVTSSPPHRLPFSTFLSSQQPPVHSAPQSGAQGQQDLSADPAFRPSFSLQAAPSPSISRVPCFLSVSCQASLGFLLVIHSFSLRAGHGLEHLLVGQLIG